MKKIPYGIVSAAGAYMLWGILPIYWKLVSEVPAHEILAHRIFWSFIFMLCVVIFVNRKKPILTEMRQVIAEPKKLLAVTMGSMLISLNWFLYIWAVNSDRVIETSLGYYINPLFSVLLAVIVLKERLSYWQIIAVFLAMIGVLNMTVHFGAIPWVALLLAVTFGLYGLCKKMANITAITSITLETLVMTPFAFLYLVYVNVQGAGYLLDFSGTSGFLIGTGIVTAVPLLLFAHGANKLSLTVLGFIQYLSPTIALMLGIFLYHEPFTKIHLVSFGFIWVALGLFSLSKTELFMQIESLVLRKLAAPSR
ncbi:EamA family transporter RarD [Sporomusa carbonis]